MKKLIRILADLYGVSSEIEDETRRQIGMNLGWQLHLNHYFRQTHQEAGKTISFISKTFISGLEVTSFDELQKQIEL